MNAYHSKPSNDPNWVYSTMYFDPVNVTKFDSPILQVPVRHDGTTRIRDYPNMPMSIHPLGYMQPRKPYVANNLWKMKFFNSRRGQGDVYDHYRYAEVPNGNYIPRSRANGAEYRRSIENEYLYRREDEYELQNTVIDPTHLSEMTPERIAADPNQAIHNYYYGLTDESDKHMQKLFQKSRWRDTTKKNKRKNLRQTLTATDAGKTVKYDETEVLYW
jgi:hypothetical protein